jgi:hypothetical protein
MFIRGSCKFAQSLQSGPMASTPSVGTNLLPETPACLRPPRRYTATMRFLLMLAVACGVVGGAMGQGSPLQRPAAPPSVLELQTEVFQDRFLPGESLEIEVRIRNLSGQPVTFRPEDDWLNITIWSLIKSTGEGAPVAQFKPVRIRETFTIPHTKAIRARVDVAPCFDLSRPGRFRLDAALTHATVREPVRATPLLFEVVPGSRLWEQTFGFRPLDADAPPEQRKYTLQKMTTKTEARLYVGVSDAEDQFVFRQVSLGRAANSDNPQRRLDRLSNLHVIHQIGPRTFTHTVINPRGDVLRRMTYDSQAANIRPTLKPDEEGRVTVVGGVRVPRADDIPANPAPPAPQPEPVALP